MNRLSPRCCLALLTVAAAAASTACAPPPKAPSSASTADAEWVSGPTDLRKITAVVRVTPPARLKSQMERAAARSSDPDFSDFLRAHAAGGFGSGFLVVHRGASGARAFIVTNRHVVAGAEDAEVEFGDGTTYKGCEIVYVSPKADLAVVALPDSAIRTFDHGLRPAKGEIKERLTVIATGYPGVGGKPSFQMTDGKISNARFTQPELGVREVVYQHTAPIDPGSSGGPLTNEAGDLVGVNVALVRGRSSMFFAVPASDVVESVRHAHDLVTSRKSASWMTHELEAACSALGAELASSDVDAKRMDSFVSNTLVAEQGLESFAYASSREGIGASVRQQFYRDPVVAMRTSLLVRVLLRAKLGGGATGSCGAINPSDASTIIEGHAVRVALQTHAGEMELRWKFEQGAWRVAGGDLIDVDAVMNAEAKARAEAAHESSPTVASKAPRKAASRGGKR
jgi:serine protease Do